MSETKRDDGGAAIMVTIQTPTVPNYVTVNLDGKEPVSIGVETLNDEQLERIGAAWTAKLIQRAESRRRSAQEGGE